MIIGPCSFGWDSKPEEGRVTELESKRGALLGIGSTVEFKFIPPVVPI